MAYLIHFQDGPGTQGTRLRTRDAHIEYMRKNIHRVIASGGLLSDDASVANGGVIIIDCDTKAEAQAFVHEDPFHAAGVFDAHRILKFERV